MKNKRLCIKSTEDRIAIMEILKESNPDRYSDENPMSFANMILDMAELEGIGFDDIKSVTSAINIIDKDKFVKELEKIMK